MVLLLGLPTCGDAKDTSPTTYPLFVGDSDPATGVWAMVSAEDGSSSKTSDGNESGALERAEELAGKIVSVCVELGGSITGEHGVGMEKRQFLPKMFNDVDIGMMKSIRRSVDPHEIANRDKMFPSAEASSLSMYGLHPLEAAGRISRE